MSDPVKIKLEPLGQELECQTGQPLRDLLFEHGVEFPCGGRGRCQGCRVRVVAGTLEPDRDDWTILGEAAVADGWRLGCRARATGHAVLELEQWETAILGDSRHVEFIPRPGVGVAVDLGTTTLVVQLVDLTRGDVLAVQTAVNPQARFGADLMSRVQAAMDEWGLVRLRDLIRERIGAMIAQALETAAPAAPLTEVTIVGNTVMHHLFCGIAVDPLSHFPFESAQPDARAFQGSELGWMLKDDPRVIFLPCLGGFVGSDVLAGVLATGMGESDTLQALIDLGTNGEIVVGDRQGFFCASTAAGPAFEGARISMGMRAATGAIDRVETRPEGGLHYHVIGGGPPRGLCGSGLVDVVDAGLRLGTILPTGRLAGRETHWRFAPPVALSQCDVRELQLAKGAIAAGLRILLKRRDAGTGDLERLHLSGAFGNYINAQSAQRIGLIPLPCALIHAAGNTALLGARMALLGGPAMRERMEALRRTITHVPLHTDPAFMDTYVAEMAFPADPPAQ